MSRYHLRIVLLSLGVLFGYGGAIFRHYRATHGGQSFFCGHRGDGPGASLGGPPPKSVQ